MVGEGAQGIIRVKHLLTRADCSVHSANPQTLLSMMDTPLYMRLTRHYQRYRFPEAPGISTESRTIIEAIPAQWRRRYESAHRKYACYLRKYTPNQTLLNEDDLKAAFDAAKDAIPENYHSLIVAFIGAPTGWN